MNLATFLNIQVKLARHFFPTNGKFADKKYFILSYSYPGVYL